MIIRRLLGGRSVAAVGLGCMSLSHGYGRAPDRAYAAALLNRALDLGYDHLDTARLYGLGHNEALIGEALKGRRGAFFLASKCGIVADGDKRSIDCSPAAITAALDASLAALQTDHIDLYYMHRRDFTVPIEDSMAVLAAAVKAGKIGSIGLSEMSADTLRRAAAVHPVAAMQTERSWPSPPLAAARWPAAWRIRRRWRPAISGAPCRASRAKTGTATNGSSRNSPP
jgi:aryl-alcohol dehydrogenase-like predicted oxidoreductase